jgi:thiopurine S-methyltransferase
MEANFWLERWDKNQTAFHENKPNALLTAYFDALSKPKGSRVFLPLCGKTNDIAWLLSQGYRVAGAELSTKAVTELFTDLGITPAITQKGALMQYSAKNLDIFNGDIFELSANLLGPVDAVYDRAALVALPESMRGRYAMHLMEMTRRAPQLLICYEYDQRLQEGPPFSVTGDEIRTHYGADYAISPLASAEIPGGLKGKCAASEHIWLLKA